MGVEVNIETNKLAKYRGIISGIAVEDRQKDEMIEIVLNIMQAFVDNAFGVGSSQLALKKIQLTSSFQEAARDRVQNENDAGILQLDAAAKTAMPEP